MNGKKRVACDSHTKVDEPQ